MKRFISFGICAVLLLIPCFTANGTTIVLARSASEIVIGADSKLTDTYGNALGNTACKIQQIGNLFIAIEGFLRDRQTGFSVNEIARRALQLKPDAPAEAKVNVLTGFLTSALFVELLNVKVNSPQEFRTKFEGQTFLRVIVAGFEKNKPVVFVRQFRLAFLARNIGVVVIPDDCLADCKEEVATRFIGETEAIEGLPDETTDFWKDGLVNGVRRLVEMEVTARSEYVGPPIDIVQINARGATWIQKKAECPEAHNVKGRPAPTRSKRRR